MRLVAGCTRMPDLRAGNATINAKGGETLASLQEAAGLAGQWLPVDTHGRTTIAELCLSRDGGPREARYGPLRGRVLSLGTRGLRFGTEAVKDVAGYDVRRAWLGQIVIAHATLRLVAHQPWRADAVLRGGDAFALAETLRALPSAPAAILVLSPDVVAISDTGMVGPGIPTFTYGLRGILCMEIRLRGPSADLHSGIFGGSVANPATVLSRIIA